MLQDSSVLGCCHCCCYCWETAALGGLTSYHT